MKISHLYTVLARVNRKRGGIRPLPTADLKRVLYVIKDTRAWLSLDDSVEELIGRQPEVTEHLTSGNGFADPIDHSIVDAFFEALKEDRETRPMFPDVASDDDDDDSGSGRESGRESGSEDDGSSDNDSSASTTTTTTNTEALRDKTNNGSGRTCSTAVYDVPFSRLAAAIFTAWLLNRGMKLAMKTLLQHLDSNRHHAMNIDFDCDGGHAAGANCSLLDAGGFDTGFDNDDAM